MSNRARPGKWAFLSALALASAGYLAGCEDNAKEESYHDADVSPLVVSPSSATLEDGTYVVFTAVGGTMPYTWYVTDTSLGTVSNTQGSIVTYQRSGSAVGANQVVAVDQSGWSSFGVVHQLAAASNATASASP